jgi:hypothetical protein
VFATIFFVEFLLKFWVYRKNYFKMDRWNAFDFAVVCGTFVGILIEELSGTTAGGIVSVVRFLRVARLLRLVHFARGLQKIFNAFIWPRSGHWGILEEFDENFVETACISNSWHTKFLWNSQANSQCSLRTQVYYFDSEADECGGGLVFAAIYLRGNGQSAAGQSPTLQRARPPCEFSELLYVDGWGILNNTMRNAKVWS